MVGTCDDLEETSKLRWRASDDTHVTVFSRLIALHDNGEEKVVSLEADSRDLDLLREACGLSAKSRAVTTRGDTKLENDDRNVVECEWSKIMPIVNDEAGICCSRHGSVRMCGHMAKPTVKRCVRYIHGHSRRIQQFFPLKMKRADLTSTQTATGPPVTVSVSVHQPLHLVVTHQHVQVWSPAVLPLTSSLRFFASGFASRPSRPALHPIHQSVCPY